MIPGCSFNSTKGHSPTSLWLRRLHHLPDLPPSQSETLWGLFSSEMGTVWPISLWTWMGFGAETTKDSLRNIQPSFARLDIFLWVSILWGCSSWRTHSFTEPSYPGPGSQCLVWIRVLSSFFTPQKIKDNTDTNNTNPPLWEWAAGGIMPEKGSVKWLG